VADKKEKVEKKRRIKGDAFWKLKGFENKIKDLQEEITEWELKKAEELKLYPDQINWATGAIFDVHTEVENGRVVHGKAIDRLSFEVLNEHKSILDKAKQIDKDMDAFKNKLARQMKIWPDMIDMKTGIIADDLYDGFDPDDESEIEEEIEEQE